MNNRCDRCSIWLSKVNINKHKLTCKESFVGKMASLSCPVCKESYHNIPGDKVNIIKKCSHLICSSCIRMLILMNKYIFPVCRAPFNDEDISKPH